MKSDIKKFLEFNGQTIFFSAIDGQYWIAIKPICEAFNISFKQQLERIKSDEILGQLYRNTGMVAADNKLRKMASLPEKFIYGWLFSIQSKSPELIQYKRECYEVLFNFFHGTITGRKDLLKEKAELSVKMHRISSSLQEDDRYCEYLKLDKKLKSVDKDLRTLDKQVIDEQLPLFEKN